MRAHSSPLSRRSSCLTDSSDSARKGSDGAEPIKVLVANWKVKGSVDCQVMVDGDADADGERPSVASFLRCDAECGVRKVRDPGLRASIAVCAASHPPKDNIHMRQRALTVSGDGCRSGRSSFSCQSPVQSPESVGDESQLRRHPAEPVASDELKVFLLFFFWF